MIVFEKFVSISGEVGGFPQGQVCLFVRFAGCNLECAWCDTAITQNIHQFAKTESPENLLSWALSTGIKHIVLTGGEPLLQKELTAFIWLLHAADFNVSIETNGSLLVPREIPFSRITWVMDYKLPSSGHVNDMISIEAMVGSLPKGSVIKFPCKDEFDFEFATYFIMQIEGMGCDLGWVYAFSPVNPEGGFAKELAKKVVCFVENAKVPAVYSLQIHKFLDVL